MAKWSEKPKRHVISFRVTDEEMDSIRLCAGAADRKHAMLARDLVLEGVEARLAAVSQRGA